MDLFPLGFICLIAICLMSIINLDKSGNLQEYHNYECHQYYEVNSVQYPLTCIDPNFYKIWIIKDVDFVNKSLVVSSIFYAKKASEERKEKYQRKVDQILNASISFVSSNKMINELRMQNVNESLKRVTEAFVHDNALPSIGRSYKIMNPSTMYYEHYVKNLINVFNDNIIERRNEILVKINSLKPESRINVQEAIKYSNHCMKEYGILYFNLRKMLNIYDTFSLEAKENIYSEFTNYLINSGYGSRYGSFNIVDVIVETGLCPR